MLNSGIIASAISEDRVPTWHLTQITPSFQDEVGAVITQQLKCVSSQVGAQVVIRISGQRVLTEGYAELWTDSLVAAATAAGCTTEVPQSDRVIITIGADYSSSGIIEWTMNGIADEWTQERVSFAPDYSQTNYHLESSNEHGVPSERANNSVSFWLKDTSLDPIDVKKMAFESIYGNFIHEGNALRWTLSTLRVEVGTTFKIYLGGASYYTTPDWEEDANVALTRAVEAAGCTIVTGIPEGRGGIITITEAYDPDSPIRFEWKTVADQTIDGTTENGTLPEDMHFFLTEVSDPDIRVIKPIFSSWITDTSQEAKPTRWRIKQTPDRPMQGETITHTLSSPTGVTAASIDLQEVGELLATFDQTLDASLTAAASNTTGVSYSGGTITVDATWSGELIFTRELTSATESYYGVRLSNPVDSDIIIQTGVSLLNYTPVIANDHLTGVNLSSGEFGSNNVPGTYQSDYIYPSVPESSTDKHRDMDYWNSQGIDVIRLPFLWGRVQHSLYADLYDGGFSGTYSGAMDMARIDEIVATWTGFGKHIILDVHNYSRYDGNFIGVEAGETPPTAFYDLWEKLATRYKNNDKVLFGIMNEPVDIPVQDWAEYAIGCVAAIRAVGAKNRVLIPSISYTGAHNWTTNGSAATYWDYKDPVGETIFEVHQYLDAGFSGTSDVCSTDTGLEIQNVTTWALERGVKLFLGEFNGGANTKCLNEINALLGIVESNPDAWLGWTAWGAGTWWHSQYIFFLNPQDYDDPNDLSPCWAQIKPHVGV